MLKGSICCYYISVKSYQRPRHYLFFSFFQFSYNFNIYFFNIYTSPTYLPFLHFHLPTTFPTFLHFLPFHLPTIL